MTVSMGHWRLLKERPDPAEIKGLTKIEVLYIKV
jgi:hypothetical protein